ncbi:TetR family transcriptional regulator [Mycobacterium sp. M1]|uniref:TetR family transcriptional regulator n=1 Tax=Mycolicibacter acidiphilus TaxID=2835306 RepID=A0ABS5RHA7_9MYCO|nr:TetR family transcriptional regulator [Mycolicibacter acidiphilus]MBS9533685.1 TetR family transcriptional regulator [Mycolicibacter acidiphilus]
MRSTGELRGEILAAARSEFAQYGLAGARIDRIARTAAASKERLYAHFGDKETLFHEVLAADAAEFLAATPLRADAVAEFVGEIYDLARTHPEHFRMINWARLEGVDLGPPDGEGLDGPAQAFAAIRQAQETGAVDPAWRPDELLVLLFGLGLAWSSWPDPLAATEDADEIAHRRASAVEAATRIIAVRT